MALLQQPDDRYELTFIQKSVRKVLGDVEAIGLHKAEMRAFYYDFLQGMVYDLNAYVLADHLEHQEVTYTETVLPRWLRWLKRFVEEREYVIKLDAYHTYPESRVAIPDLGQSRKTITFSKTRIDNIYG